MRRWLQRLFGKRRADEGDWPTTDAHKGKPLAEVLRELGKPDKDLVGYWKHWGEQPSEDIPQGAPPAPHRTLVYDRPAGLLYVWLHQVSGSWVCFQSFWLPETWGLRFRSQLAEPRGQHE